MLDVKRRDILHEQLARRVHLRESAREEEKSFPIRAEEVERFLKPRLQKELQDIGDVASRQAFTEVIRAFAVKFSVTLTDIKVTSCSLMPYESGGVYRMGPLAATELRLLLRRKKLGPRILVIMTFPEGSVAGHRHDRIAQIIAELAAEDQARLEKNEPPLLAEVKLPSPAAAKGSADRVNSVGKALAEQKRLRIQLALLHMGAEYQQQQQPFKLAEAIQFVFNRTKREYFPTVHYAASAIDALEKRHGYFERGAKIKGVNTYFMTQKGRARLNELRAQPEMMKQFEDASSAQ